MTHARSHAMRIVAALALSAFLGGCTTVHVARPIGDIPVTLDPAEWNGTWCDAQDLAARSDGPERDAPDAECLSITVVDSARGVLDAVSPSEPGESYRAHLRFVGSDREAMFVSVEEGPAFAFELRARRDGRLLVTWSVSGDAFARAIAAGHLPGRAEDGRVQLDPTPAALARIAGSGGDLYDWTHPVVLVRKTGFQP